MGITKQHTTIIIVTLLISFAVSVPIALFILPAVYRNHQISKLSSSDPAEKRMAYVYIQKHVARQPDIVSLVVPNLYNADDRSFLQVVAILDAAGHWRPQAIEPVLYLRYTQYLASDLSEDARILAAQKLSSGYPYISLEQAIPQLEILIEDLSPLVRYNTLIAASAYHSRDAQQPLLTLISPLVNDPQPTIAYHARLILSLLGHHPELPDLSQLVSMSPANQQASIYAVIKSLESLEAMQFARTVVGNPELSLEARAMAISALSDHCFGETDPRVKYLDIFPADISTDNQLLAWRAIMALPDSAVDQYRFQLTRFATADSTNALLAPLVYASTYRLAIPYIHPADTTRLKELAALEGSPPASTDIAITSQSPDMLRLAALRAMNTPTVGELLPLYDSLLQTIHNQAALIAATRFSSDQQAEIIAKLLLNYSETARQSAAIIFGLAPQQTHDKHLDLQLLLRKKIDDEDQWHVKRTLELGLWMRKLKPYPREYAADLLTRQDIPATTTLLALLARQPQIALDYILSPAADLQPIMLEHDQQVDVPELLVKHRWYYVLQHYLPEDAPVISLWADAELQQFQFDLLRNWYLLNRYRFAEDHQ